MLGLGVGFYRLGGNQQRVYRGGIKFDLLTALEAADHNDFTIAWDKDDRNAAGMSIAITMKFNSWDGTTYGSHGIISKSNEWAVYLLSGALYFAVHDESANKSKWWNLNKSEVEAHILPDTYYNFVFRTGADTEGIYIDGTNRDNQAGTHSGFVADENLTGEMFIGKAQALSSSDRSSFTFFKGTIDDVVIWKSAALMTVAQLQAYNNLVANLHNKTGVSPLNDNGDYDISDDVVAWYDFTSLEDSSGNNHDLTLTSGATKFV